MGPKIDQKSMPRCLPMLRSFFDGFDRFWDPTSIPRRPIGASGLDYFWVFRFPCNIDFGLHFGANLASFSLPKSKKNTPKMEVQDASIFGINFGIDFGAIWAPSWGPSWGQVGVFWPTRRTQDPPRKPIKVMQMRKRAQDPSQTPPGPLWTSILGPRTSIFH